MRSKLITSVIAVGVFLANGASAEQLTHLKRPLLSRAEQLTHLKRPLFARTEQLTHLKRPLVTVE